MVYELIVFSALVLIWGVNNYLKKIDLPLWVKITYLIITFLLFEYYFGSFRITLWDLYRNGFEVFHSTAGVYAFNKNIDLSISILFFLVSFFVSGLALNIAVKAKSRKLLLWSTPIIIIVTILDFYKSSILESGFARSTKTFLVFTIMVSVILGVINLIYNLNPWKQIFILAKK
jgi:hypothetical protein